MKIYVVMMEGCEDCGGVSVIGVFTNKFVANDVSNHKGNLHYAWVSEFELDQPPRYANA